THFPYTTLFRSPVHVCIHLQAWRDAPGRAHFRHDAEGAPCLARSRETQAGGGGIEISPAIDTEGGIGAKRGVGPEVTPRDQNLRAGPVTLLGYDPHAIDTDQLGQEIGDR